MDKEYTSKGATSVTEDIRLKLLTVRTDPFDKQG